VQRSPVVVSHEVDGYALPTEAATATDSAKQMNRLLFPKTK
jgi:hypothetical protein